MPIARRCVDKTGTRRRRARHPSQESLARRCRHLPRSLPRLLQAARGEGEVPDGAGVQPVRPGLLLEGGANGAPQSPPHLQLLQKEVRQRAEAAGPRLCGHEPG